MHVTLIEGFFDRCKAAFFPKVPAPIIKKFFPIPIKLRSSQASFVFYLIRVLEWFISRVLYPQEVALPWVVTIYLGLLLPTGSSDLPGDSGGPPSTSPYLVLLQAGFAKPRRHRRAGELLPHLFTLTPFLGRCIFCGTFLPVTRTGCYPAPCPVEPGLSSLLGGHLLRSNTLGKIFLYE